MSAKQQRAIYLLVSGQSILDTAREVGVNASTIHRWHRNFKFQAALNDAKKRVMEVAHSLLVAVCIKAAENISNAIMNGNTELSFKVLDKVGILSKPRTGPDDHISVGVAALQEEMVRIIGEGGVSALAQLRGLIEEDQGEFIEKMEAVLESDLDPEEDRESDS